MKLKNLAAWRLGRRIWFSAEYIPGKQNVIANSFSRVCHENIEWMVEAATFSKLGQKFFNTLNVDHFGSCVNRRVEPFVSWQSDPDAMTSNVFSLNWDNFRRYIFPPYCLITRILQKLSCYNRKPLLFRLGKHIPGTPGCWIC